MTNIVPFDFHGDRLLLVDEHGEPRIVLKPAIEALGLDYWAQIEKLKKRSWAALGSSRVQVPEQGQHREMLTATVRTFLMLLATIDENRVSKDVRVKLVAYQAEVADAIEDYWTKGGAINPRASEDELRLLKAQADVLTALRPIADAGWLDAKARILGARALGETPELDQATKPLTVSIYLSRKGLKGKEAKAVAPMFGKRLKAAYVEAYSAQPPSVEDVVGRHVVNVAQYQEQHSHLFDRIWSQYYGGAA